jgi:hypothetical protein
VESTLCNVIRGQIEHPSNFRNTLAVCHIQMTHWFWVIMSYLQKWIHLI